MDIRDNKDRRADAYDHIIAYENDLHEKNQRRIKIGIRLIMIVPLLFLAIMFKMDSSKVVFLVLWIASLFSIAGYLIVVEYADYKIQHQLKEWGLSDTVDFKGLISDRETVVEKVLINGGKLIEQRIEQERLQNNSGSVLQIEQKSSDELEEYDEEEYDEEEYDEEEYDEEEYDEEEYDEEEYDEEEYDEEEYDEEEYDEEEHDGEECDEEEYEDEVVENYDDEYNEEYDEDEYEEEESEVLVDETETDKVYFIDEEREKITLGKKKVPNLGVAVSKRKIEEKTETEPKKITENKKTVEQKKVVEEKPRAEKKTIVASSKTTGTKKVPERKTKQKQGMAYSLNANTNEDIVMPIITVTPKNIVVNSPSDYINKRKKKTTHKKNTVVSNMKRGKL